MGKHGSRREPPSNPLLGYVRDLQQQLGLPGFYLLAGLASFAVIAVLISLAVSGGSSTSSSSSASSSSTTTNPYTGYEDNSAYVTPGWNNSTNRADFTEHLHAYEQQAGVTFPNSGVLYNIGIDSCIQLRKGRSDRILGDAQRDKVRGETWAIVNSALDVYCPDQQQYRYLIHR